MPYHLGRAGEGCGRQVYEAAGEAGGEAGGGGGARTGGGQVEGEVERRWRLCGWRDEGGTHLE